MNSHRDRIYHFKGNPREIGFAAGQTLAGTLEETICRYFARVQDAKDLESMQTSHVRAGAKSGIRLGDIRRQARETGKKWRGRGWIDI